MLCVKWETKFLLWAATSGGPQGRGNYKDGVFLRRDILYEVIAFLGPALELILGAFPSAKQSLSRVGWPVMVTLVSFGKCLNKFIGAEFVVELEHG
jgi:hypothetical protein